MLPVPSCSHSWLSAWQDLESPSWQSSRHDFWTRSLCFLNRHDVTRASCSCCHAFPNNDCSSEREPNQSSPLLSCFCQEHGTDWGMLGSDIRQLRGRKNPESYENMPVPFFWCLTKIIALCVTIDDKTSKERHLGVTGGPWCYFRSSDIGWWLLHMVLSRSHDLQNFWPLLVLQP